MKERLLSVCTGISACVLFVLCAQPSNAQTGEVKQKAPLYSYIANWQIPRAQWGEMQKANLADKGLLDKAIADGTLVGYGYDETLVHQADGITHDDWWASMSLGGLIKVLDQLSTSGSTTSSVLGTATKHSDAILVSHYYNWHPGAFKDNYGHVASYRLKADAPDDAVEMISKSFVVPLMEKLLSSGAIREYEVDTEAIHTTDPATFWIVYIATSPDGLDAVDSGLRDALKGQPLAGPAFGSMTDNLPHRDELLRSEGTYK
ncbi:MAG TPA: hypothetical protein VHZ28_05960 [Terracidiphilus sp.]|nr:hypothetical protein [Terracidiphilus sp.]